jgi:hypothetical protein
MFLNFFPKILTCLALSFAVSTAMVNASDTQEEENLIKKFIATYGGLDKINTLVPEAREFLGLQVLP